MTKTKLFVGIVVFWTLLLIVSSFFGETLTNYTPDAIINAREEDTGVFDTIIGTLTNVPVIGSLVKLIQIMTFQFTAEFPVLITILLDIIFILTLYVGYHLIHPTKRS